jgi:predicted ATPase
VFQSITIKNLLPFGPENPELPLENVNVLIGPNGSGKSNLLDTLDLIRDTARGDSKFGFRSVVRNGGGPKEWIWNGSLMD